MKYLYKNLENLLKERNLTIYKVAKDTNISTTTLYAWKHGEYTPKIDKLIVLAKYFGVNVIDFIRSDKND